MEAIVIVGHQIAGFAEPGDRACIAHDGSARGGVAGDGHDRATADEQGSLLLSISYIKIISIILVENSIACLWCSPRDKAAVVADLWRKGNRTVDLTGS